MASRVQGGRAAQAFIRKAKAAQRAAPESVAVGYFPDQRYPDNTPVATVAVVNEFGSDNRKESAFFRKAMAQAKSPVRASVKASLRGSRGTMALSDAQAIAAGNVMAEKIKQSVAAEGLVDTGQLQRSPDARVE